jgi:iron complex outermembrane receptor protein
MTRLLNRSVLSLGTALGFVLSVPVAAQEAAQDGAQPDGEILVTARRVEERLQDVPISISVFSQKQLTQANVVNAQDLANITPSLSVNTNFGSNNTSFAIRGFVQDIGTPPSVGVYFGDVVAPRASSNGIQSGDGAGPGSFFDLQNVQVLKGPQGTLFGRNTTGGAVLIVPQKPTDKLEGYAEGSIGNYDLRRVQAVLNLPVGEAVRLRFGVDRNKRDGYLKNDLPIGPRDLADVDYTALRASMVLDIAPNLENYTIASWVRSRTNGFTQKPIACAPGLFLSDLACGQIAAAEARGAGFYTVQVGVPETFSRTKQWQAINTTTWHVSDTLTIKNIASYAELRNSLRFPFGGTYFPISPTQTLFVSVLTPIPGGNSASQSTFTEELQFQGSSANSRLEYQGGVYYESSKPLGESGIAPANVLSCANAYAGNFECSDPLGQAFGFNVGNISLQKGKTSFRDVGLYAQASYALTNQFKLTGGLRYTWDRQVSRSTRISYSFPVTPPFDAPPTATCMDANTAPSCMATLRQKSSKPTWLLDLDYKPSADALLYGKYARGYRAGGILPEAPAAYRAFEPEKVDNFELGVKLTFPGATRGHFNLAGFYNNFANQQLMLGFAPKPGAPGGPTTGVVNVGKSRIYGIEAEASISPFQGFTLDASYTYLSAKIRRIAALNSIDPNYTLNASIEAGNPLLLSPKNKFTIGASYSLQTNESVGEVTFGAQFVHIDKQLSNYLYNDPGVFAAYGRNLGLLPGYNLLNLSFSWNRIAGSPVDLSLFATNVANEKYLSFVPGVGGNGLEVATLGEPRMFGMKVRYNFGD